MAFGDYAIRDEDVERSLIDYFLEQIADGVRVDVPGETFNAVKAKEWVDIRIGSLDHRQESKPGEEFANMDLVIRCFVKVDQKGKRRLNLSRLVDKVLDVVGGERQVNAAVILNPLKVDVGRIQFGSSLQSRNYGATESVDGVSIAGLDIATISIPTLVTGDP